MKLYYFMVAPNPTKVRLYLAEKRGLGGELPVEAVVVNLGEGEQKSPEHLARNPMGNLPVLELEDGSFLTESLVIIEYLEECHPEPPMIGRDPAERARVRRLERIAEQGVLVPLAWCTHLTNSPLGMEPNPPVAEFFRLCLEEPLQLLDETLADGRPFVAGERPTIADCSLAAGLQFGRLGKIEIEPRFEKVLRWDADYRGRSEVSELFLV